MFSYQWESSISGWRKMEWLPVVVQVRLCLPNTERPIAPLSPQPHPTNYYFSDLSLGNVIMICRTGSFWNHLKKRKPLKLYEMESLLNKPLGFGWHIHICNVSLFYNSTKQETLCIKPLPAIGLRESKWSLKVSQTLAYESEMTHF